MPQRSATLAGLRGAVFDMDGTLVDSELDFERIRTEAGVPEGTPILEFLQRAAPQERDRARSVLLEHEERAADSCRLVPGARTVLHRLRRRGMKLALLTRNSRRSMRRVLERFELRFDVCLAREDARPKPAPEPVLKIASGLGLAPRELVVVGDYLFDLQAGRRAGALTALLRTERNASFAEHADLLLEKLTELPDLLDGACPGEEP